MHRHLKLFGKRFRAALPALVLISSILAVRAGQPGAMPQVDEVALTKSVFVDDAKFGKDPFFPKSKRHVPKVVVPIGVVADVSPFTQVLSSLVLKGISSLPGRRLALLNNKTLQAGEETEIKVNNQAFKIRCLEIREKSILLGMEGTTETKEIRLRSGM